MYLTYFTWNGNTIMRFYDQTWSVLFELEEIWVIRVRVNRLKMTEKLGEIHGEWNLVRVRGRNVDGTTLTYLKGCFSIDDIDGS